MRTGAKLILVIGCLCIGQVELHAQGDDRYQVNREVGTAAEKPHGSDDGGLRGPAPGKRGRGGKGASPESGAFQTEVPQHDVDVLLCRPTSTGVTVSVLAYAPATAYVRYGTDAKNLGSTCPPQTLQPGIATNFLIDGLLPDTSYCYQLVTEASQGAILHSLDPENFHTQRLSGSPFTFAIQADSHLDGATNTAVYRTTLENIKTSAPDFMIDLGDTFMTEKHVDRTSAERQYFAQRYYFGTTCNSVPLLLVLGNHDGEMGRFSGGTDSLSAWSCRMRSALFPNPVPGPFFTGNSNPDTAVGLLQDYYAWTWGEALFVVLDPFWYSGVGVRGPGEPWDRTLGEAQYRWLAETLHSSTARYKFIFIHHLVGGGDRNARGGAEASHLFEWGGTELDGTSTFSTRRPGWAKPIHELLVDEHVSAVFHGHDHFFMKQEIDGIVYQLVPQPGHKGAGSSRSAAEYGYLSGDIVTGSGFLRVQVSEKASAVEFVRTGLAPDRSGPVSGEEIAFRYEISPNH